MCEDSIEAEDLHSLSASLGWTTTKTSTVIICGNNIVADEALDWNLLEQAVFIHCISRTKASVYFVTIATDLVAVFAVGPCENVELQQFSREIMNYLAKVLPRRSFSFQFRLQIPLSFFKDKLFMALVLAMQLHEHGKYLLVHNDKLPIYKWKCLDSFQRTHDNLLGSLDLSLGYPFHVEEQNQDDGGKLTSLGWALVDVDGDGNCGPYALMLGLHNNKQTMLYNPFYFAENGERTEGRREINTEHLELEWQKQSVRLRIDLRDHSIRLLKATYKLGREPTWWWKVGPMTAEDRTENNDNLYMRGYKVHHYFPKCPNELMMIGCWGGFVFASKFRIRLVLIQRRNTDAGWDWTTNIYSSQDNVEPQVFNHIHRLSDDDDDAYREEPTVEFFQSSGPTLDPHFQFLRRVYCDQAADDEKQNNETLLGVLKREQQKEKNKPATAPAASDQSTNAGSDKQQHQADALSKKQKASPDKLQRSQERKAAAAAVPEIDSQQQQPNGSHEPSPHLLGEPNEAAAAAAAAVPVVDSHQRDASHEPSPQTIEEPNEAAADVPLVDSQQNQRGASNELIPQHVDKVQEPFHQLHRIHNIYSTAAQSYIHFQSQYRSQYS